jgi:hypothetical protein
MRTYVRHRISKQLLFPLEREFFPSSPLRPESLLRPLHISVECVQWLLSFLIKRTETKADVTPSTGSEPYSAWSFISTAHLHLPRVISLSSSKLDRTLEHPIRTAKKTPHFTVTKINRLTLFMEIIAVYCANHTKHINTK